MVNANELKAAFKRKAYTQEDVAKMLGITPRTLSNKMKRGVFNSNEIERLIEVLDIKEPLPIFFAR